jgi:hypothetical protein
MTTRAVGAMAGIDWLRQAVNLGRQNPKAIFGGALLLLVAIIALVIVMALLVGGLGLLLPEGGAVAGGLSVLVAGGEMALMAILIAGYLRLLDAVENGRPASAVDVFSALGQGAMAVRAILFMLVLMLAQNVLIVGLIGLLAPDFGSWYLQNLQASMAGAPAPATLPGGFGIVMVLMWVIGMFAYGVQSIGFGQIALRGQGVGSALSAGATGTAKNLLPLLVLFLAMVLAAIALAIAMGLLLVLVGLLGKLVGNWLLVLVGVPLYIVFVVGLMVVMFGVMYFMWRDICGGGAPVAAPSDDRIEV